MDEYLVGGLVAAALVALFATLMIRSWRARRGRDAGIVDHPQPAEPGAPVLEAPVMHVATTPHRRPVERLAPRGLGFRAAGRIDVRADGLVLDLRGEQPVYVPADALVEVTTASWAIDRGVEPEGLIALSWRARTAGDADASDDLVVDTYLRAQRVGDATRIVDALTTLAGAGTAPGGDNGSEA
ncbi:PH-like domain-containing protein [Agromyces chitinivorans]|uniref:PH-like domain-containing protein n=1 Tax=Agromyces chitinivorans TaxID=3158560 RepID=UPI0033991F5F